MDELSELDKRIVAALQVDGRAPWAKIASALGEPDRTVARRGTELLADQRVRIRAMPNPRRLGNTEQFVLKVSCTAGTAGIAAGALARRPETMYAYLLTGSADCAAELSSPVSRYADLMVRDIGSIPGVLSSVTYPVLGYFRTMHQWNPGILAEAELSALGGVEYSEAPTDVRLPEQLGKEDRQILRTLRRDGRASFEELSKISGFSVQTVQRRVERMRRDGTLYVRAVFEPVLLGRRVEVLLWIKAAFPDLELLGSQIIKSPAVRYAAILAGDCQLLVNAVFASRSDLYTYLRTSEWVEHTQSIEPSLVVDALKRSGTLGRAFGDDLAE